jgi:hypothetical protein
MLLGAWDAEHRQDMEGVGYMSDEVYRVFAFVSIGEDPVRRLRSG